MRTLEELKSELSMPTSFQVQPGFPVRQHALSSFFRWGVLVPTLPTLLYN